MSNYYYLAASLPMLHFGAKPPFSFEGFLKTCGNLIPQEDFVILCSLPQPQDYNSQKIENGFLQQWVDFDTSLRNELAKIRMRKKNIDASRDLRSSQCTDYTLSQSALSASRIPAALDAERSIDERRWKALEEFCQGHFFDLEFIICYAYKLLILERWERIRTANKQELTEVALRQH